MKSSILLALVMAWACTAFAEKPRVFITDSKSWEIAGGGGGSSSGFGGATRGGARPQTAEIIKTFEARCPGVVPNNKQEKADYVVLLDHEGGKGLARKDNKVAVFNWDGDAILSRSTRSLGNSVKDACDAIMKDWAQNGSARTRATETETARPPESKPSDAKTKLTIVSEPAGADIDVDGSFVGSTPSSIDLAAGEHHIIVKKPG
jgi:hypothetical protein